MISNTLPSLNEIMENSRQYGSVRLSALAHQYVIAYKTLQSEAVRANNPDLHDQAQTLLDESAVITSLSEETRVMEIFEDPNASESEKIWAKETADRIKEDTLQSVERVTPSEHRAFEPTRYR